MTGLNFIPINKRSNYFEGACLSKMKVATGPWRVDVVEERFLPIAICKLRRDDVRGHVPMISSTGSMMNNCHLPSQKRRCWRPYADDIEQWIYLSWSRRTTRLEVTSSVKVSLNQSAFG